LYTYGTTFGGKRGTVAASTGHDEAFNVVVEGKVAYIVGTTNSVSVSASRPAIATSTTDAALGIYAGHETVRPAAASDPDAFLIKIDTTRQFGQQHRYGTYIGREGNSNVQGGYGIALNPKVPGQVYVLTDTVNAGCPTAGVATSLAPNPLGGADLCLVLYDTNKAGAQSRVWATYLGGAGQDRVRPQQNCGGEAFCGSPLAIDHLGRLYIAARATAASTNANFQVKNPIAPEGPHNGGNRDDVLLVQLDLSKTGANRVVMWSYIGGSFEDRPYSLAYSKGNLYVVGDTESHPNGEFPLPNGHFVNHNGNRLDPKPAPGLDGQADGFAIRIAEMVPLDKPTFTWSAKPSDRYHVGRVHPFSQVTFDYIPVPNLEPGQEIVYWEWDFDMPGSTLTGTDADLMSRVHQRFPLQADPYLIRLTIRDNYGTTRTSDVPGPPYSKPTAIWSIENTCPVLRILPSAQAADQGETVRLAAEWMELDVDGDGRPDGAVTDGTASVRYVTDGVLTGTTTLHSASALFTPADVGEAVRGNGIPEGATIAAYVSPTQVVLSEPAILAQSGVLLRIGTDRGGWSWAFGDGESSTAPDYVVHTYKTPALFRPRVSVTDDDGCTASAVFPDIQVHEVLNHEPGPGYFGRRPTADAGPDITTVENVAVQLQAYGECAIYKWLQVGGPVIVLDDSSSRAPRFVAPDVEVRQDITLHLVCNDGRLDSLPDEVVVTVLPVNRPPRADAGLDLQAREGTPLRLDGRGSVDPEGKNLTFQWTQVRGPAVLLSRADGAEPHFLVPPFAKEAQMVFRLVVHDGVLESLPDYVTVDIKPVQDIDFRVTKQTTSGGTLVGFTPMDSTLGRNHDWDFGDGETSQEKSPRHLYREPGVYTVTLKVTQQDGHEQTTQKQVIVY
ncbi:MAG TPA: PKD domain-containing protein, partial [Candidatus Thermoplasmatota archaeon]|nr:PKD domain-containing protein [Candidatus Thermoplasmatota archaeon]